MHMLLRVSATIFVLMFTLALSACGSFLPSSGPRASSINNASDSKHLEGIRVVELDWQLLNKLIRFQNKQLFSEQYFSKQTVAPVLGNGDSIEIVIWEVSPALFGGAMNLRESNATAHGTILPEQMISDKGTILVPFVGQVRATGLTPEELQNSIIKHLKGKANQPQVLVRIVRNISSSVTVVGDVANSIRMPLTPKNERVLDAIAAAGGTRHPIEKMTVQLTRDGVTQAMPCEQILKDSHQNIQLMSNDVITLFYKPLSFTALGAAGRNEEVDFEATGISLAQALARVGGLQENSANAQGVFLFRFESPTAIHDSSSGDSNVLAKSMVPVVYRLDMKDPASFFLAQRFMMHDKDVLFVSHSSSTDLKKFFSLLVSVVYPIENIMNIGN